MAELPRSIRSYNSIATPVSQNIHVPPINLSALGIKSRQNVKSLNVVVQLASERPDIKINPFKTQCQAAVVSQI